MKRTWIQTNDGLVEVTRDRTPAAVHNVIPDIEPFRSPDGAEIHGREQWREHLKATGAVEMGHSDIKAQTEAWAKRQADHREKIAQQPVAVRQMDRPVEMRPMERSPLTREILNKLDGRPKPGRKEMIQLSLNTAREMERRGR